MAQQTIFRSRFRRYRFGDLRFENHVARTSDPRVIAKAKADPQFGQGKCFWIETGVEAAKAEEERKAENEDETGGDSKPAAKKTGSRKKTGSKKKTSSKSAAKPASTGSDQTASA